MAITSPTSKLTNGTGTVDIAGQVFTLPEGVGRLDLHFKVNAGGISFNGGTTYFEIPAGSVWSIGVLGLKSVHLNATVDGTSVDYIVSPRTEA